MTKPSEARENALALSREDRVRLEDFCRRWLIRELDLFGSGVREELRPDSDLDFLVTFDDEARWSLWDHAQMEEELAGIVGREVDLVTRRAIERSANWIRRKAILEEARRESAALREVAESVGSRLDAAIERHRPDVALLNFGTLGSPGRVVQLHHAHPDTRIVVLANRPTAAECSQMLSFGATACLSKDTEARDIVSAIHLASRGMHLLPPSVADDGLGRSGIEGAELLTPREAEVMELLREGATNAEIAHELSIGIETVRTHARAIYRKLGIGSRRELSRLATR